jgi:hypothetical protein
MATDQYFGGVCALQRDEEKNSTEAKRRRKRLIGVASVV